MKNKLFSAILVFLLAFSLIFVFAGCNESPADDPSENSGEGVGGGVSDPEKPETVRVMVSLGEGYTVKGENPVDVTVGSRVVFDIELDPSYLFISSSAGSYNPESGKLILENVTRRTNITFNVEYAGYDLTKEYIYVFYGDGDDTTSVDPSPAVRAGTEITVKAGNTKRRFLGWTYGKSYKAGAEIESSDREFTFRLTPDIVSGNAFYLYANYTDSNVYFYDPNGGSIDVTSSNMKENDYYSALLSEKRLEVTLKEKYYSYAECASTFWDDGTFSRPGYVLVEYNTLPDGTGTPYSLGSKFYTAGNDESPILYCIWQKETPAEDFSFREFTMPESPKNLKYAPDWNNTGYIITAYSGNADYVVIPEYVGKIPVIAIAEGVFTDKIVSTLVVPKTVLLIEDGAFTRCSSLETMYFPNSVYEMSDDIFDSATYASFKNFYVNSTMAPRYSHSGEGAFAVKFSKFLAAEGEKRITVISGSSTYQSLGTDYLEALFEGEYTVINFGTTRPRPGLFYLEALSHYASEDDTFVYAPENSAFMMGEKYLSWRMIRDLEGMCNLYRYVDFSNYEGYFSSMSELNKTYNYTVEERKFEVICENKHADKNGDYQNANRKNYEYSGYQDVYYITLNNRYKSINDVLWNDKEGQEFYKDYTDPNNHTWVSIDTEDRIEQMNMAIDKAKASGAKVYFGFAPTDANAIVDAAVAEGEAWFLRYDAMMKNNYHFDGILGSCMDYIFNHKYFYDCAYHTNDYGRTYRTYQLYLDLAEKLGIESPNGIYDVGREFIGCIFEEGSSGKPLFGVDFLD